MFEEEYVRAVAPRDKSSANFGSSTSSSAKPTQPLLPASAQPSVVPSHHHRATKSSTAASPSLHLIKFGPPRGSKKPSNNNTSTNVRPAPCDAPAAKNNSNSQTGTNVPSCTPPRTRSRGPSPLVSRSSTPLQIQPEVSDDAAAAEASDKETVHPPPSCQSAALPVASSSPATQPLIAQQIAVNGAGLPASFIPVAEGVTLKITASSDESCDAGSSENDAAAEEPHPAAFPDTNGGVNAHSTPKDVPPPSCAVPTEAPLIPSTSSAFAQDGIMGLIGAAPDDILRGSATHTPVSLTPVALVLPTHPSEDNVRPAGTGYASENRAQSASCLQQAVCISHAPPPGSASVPDMLELAASESEKRASKRKALANSGGVRSKKRKTNSDEIAPDSGSRTASAASSQNSNSTLVDSMNAPHWATSPLKLLQSVALGSEWDMLLTNWVAFEHGSADRSTARLGAQSRPQAVTDWIRRARLNTYSPQINSVAVFAKEFNTWWASLQPTWRTERGRGVLRRDGEDWECLRCSGINGLLSVLAALFFWGCAVQKSKAATKSAWLRAVDDVSYSMTQLLKL